jgi:hypothetical protein
MDDYEPLDLSRYFDTGVPYLNPPTRLGPQLLRGLPFRLADGPEKFVIVPTTDLRPVRVKVGRRARYVIVAHRLLDSTWAEMEAVGRHVADYVFHLEGGHVMSVPVRQRFEIEVLPSHWGFYPLLAVPDHNDGLFPRQVGLFEEAGQRQFESFQASATDYYLWAWENPAPERGIEEIELVPKGPTFAVGGITLGHLAEHPFVRQPHVPVVVEIDAQYNGLSVEIDRGVVSYINRIADPDGETNELPAWGHWASDRSYLEVAAQPSATLSVRLDGEELGRFPWSEVQRGTGVTAGPALVRLGETGRNWVHVRVVDKATGRAVPCRVQFRSPTGIPYQPHGHHNQVNSNLGTFHFDIGGDVRLGDVTYAYIDGTCQGWLPRGEVIAEVARGFEYTPLRTTVNIEPGQRELTLQISRWVDMAELGWFSGDSHVHFLSTQGAHLEQQCEDLRVVNLLQSQWGSLFTNTEDFTGRVSSTPDGAFHTYVGQENRQHVLGHINLWGLKEPVMPWCSDGPIEAELGGSLESTMSDWADRAHAQGGTVIIAHFPVPNGEAAVLATTGRADAVESLNWNRSQEAAYYAYLNCGYRLPLVGGTDKMTSDVPVGLYRTYARVDGEFSYDAWRAAVRAGRTFLSGGPIIQLKVDGHDIGDTITLAKSGTVQVEAWADGIFPLAALEVVLNGRVVAATENHNPGSQHLTVAEPVQVSGHSWLVARCYGAQAHHLDWWQRPIFAHTSPVYISAGGDWAPRDEDAANYLFTLIEGGLEYVRRQPSYYPEGSVTHHHGHADHRAFIEAPFHQALAALRARYPR